MTAFEDTILAIGIGAPRTGTRWMSNYFENHPQILMSPIRVLHYFDARHDPEAAAEYNQHFRQRLDGLLKRNADENKVAVMRDRVAMIDDESGYLRYFRNRW